MSDAPTKEYGAHSPHNPGGALGHLLHSLWCIGQLPDMEPARGMARQTLAEYERIYDSLEVIKANIQKEIEAYPANKKVYAIKLYRERTGASLMDAKTWVETHINT